MEIQTTIAIPVYERELYFIEALESALNQSRVCKILVVDNASSHDRFKDIIDQKSGNGVEIRYVKNSENLGFVGNWNRCIELCDTKYITILHDDDVLHPQFVEQAECINLDWGVLFSPSVTGENVKPGFYKNKSFFTRRLKKVTLNSFVLGNFNHVPGTIFLTKIARQVGGFTSEYGPVLDFHFWIKLTQFGNAYYLDKQLSFYRYSPSQGTKMLYTEMAANTYGLLKLIPAYNNHWALRLLADYTVYSGALDIHLLSQKPASVLMCFNTSTEFIRDHKRFYWFYRTGMFSKLCRKIALKGFYLWMKM